MKNWEYKIVDGLDEKEINALGARGWELLMVTVDTLFNYRFFFKRPKF